MGDSARSISYAPIASRGENSVASHDQKDFGQTRSQLVTKIRSSLVPSFCFLFYDCGTTDFSARFLASPNARQIPVNLGVWMQSEL